MKCPAPGCVETIDETQFVACRRHWRGLPPSLRSKINRIRLDAPANLPVQLAKAQRIWAGEPPPAVRTVVPPEEVPRIPARWTQ